MTESLEALSGARVKDFVPLFVHRFARERLRALGQVEGTIAKEVPEVLFVCVQNAGRSQMAAALLDHYAKGRVHVRSAGSEPADQINPAVVAAMSELGIDVSREFPKPMTDEVVKAADAVITMGCGDACPIYPGKRYEDWEVDDPPTPISRACVASATTSTNASGGCSPTSPPRQPPDRARARRAPAGRSGPRHGAGASTP
jgi:arsenate reductase (thioredoxin)